MITDWVALEDTSLSEEEELEEDGDVGVGGDEILGESLKENLVRCQVLRTSCGWVWPVPGVAHLNWKERKRDNGGQIITMTSSLMQRERQLNK